MLTIHPKSSINSAFCEDFSEFCLNVRQWEACFHCFNETKTFTPSVSINTTKGFTPLLSWKSCICTWTLLWMDQAKIKNPLYYMVFNE